MTAPVISLRPALGRGLQAIQDDVLRLGGMVDDAIERAVEALSRRDGALARRVIADDERVNRMRFRIEEQSLVLMATQQPAAGDLRVAIAASHLAVELERMADHAAGIATLALRMLDQPPLPLPADLPAMAMTARTMTRSALDAFVHRDAALAETVMARDDELDARYQQTLRVLLSYMLEDPRTIDRATYLLWAAHNLERIGDRATNLCERVIFVATGELREKG